MRYGRLWTAAVLIGALASAGCGRDEPVAPPIPPVPAPASPAPQAQAVPLLQLSRAVVPAHYRLELTILPESATFSGRTEIDVRLKEPRTQFYMHGRGLNMKSVRAILPDRAVVPARYEQVHASGVVRLTFDRALPAGTAKLVFVYDAPFQTALQGLYRVTDRGDHYVFSQFENIYARRAWPSFDEPAFKTPYDIVVTAPAAHQVVTNTLPAKEEQLPGGLKRITFARTQPLPTYLLAFAVGPLDIVQGPPVPANELRPQPIPVRGVTVRGKGEQMRYALAHTPQLVTLQERYFGRPYPFDKLDLIAASDFAAGGMENAGAIMYRETLMLMTATSPLDQRRRHASVHAHEIAHMWFGDLVTPVWWDDIWLNEAFATWFGRKTRAEWYPNGQYERTSMVEGLDVMRLDSLASARRIREPIRVIDDIDNAFDDITYQKGGAVLSMFESYVGKDAFRDGVRLYMRRHAYGNATTEQFFKSLAEGSRHPEMLPAVRTFLDQPNVPLVTVRTDCVSNTCKVSVRQSTSTPIGVRLPARQWKIPLCMRTLPDGRKSCVMFDRPAAEYNLGNASAVMPNADGAGYYHFTMSEAEWRNLIRNAARLNAAEQIALLRNLEAGVRTGNTKASLLFDGLRAVVPVATWDGLEVAQKIMKDLKDTVIRANERPAFEALARRLMRPRLDAVGLGPKLAEPVANSMIRYPTVWFLVNTAADLPLRAQLAPAGETYMTSGGTITGALSFDLAQYALWSAVAQDGPNFARRLIAAIKASDDQEFRRAGLFALTAVSDPQFLREVHGLSLSNDLKLSEALGLFTYLSQDANRRDAEWEWIESNLQQFEARVTPDHMSGVLRRVDGACNTGLRERIMRIYGPRQNNYEGAPRQLKQILEAVDRCLAFRRAKEGEIADALRPPGG
jgi:cytosol alanyl aminopeptidase